MGRIVCFVVFLSLCAWPAHGEEGTSDYAIGKAALARNDAAGARLAFGRALAAAGAGPERWRILLGLALAHEALEEHVHAVAHYQAFVDESEVSEAEIWQQRRASAQADLRSLVDKLAVDHARVEIRSQPAGARLSVSGTELPLRSVTPAVTFLRAGDHDVSMTLDGHEPQSFSIHVTAAERVVVDRTLQPIEATPPPAVVLPVALPVAQPADATRPADPAPAPTLDEDLSAGAIAGWVAIGLGGAALGVGVVVTAVAAGDVAELEDLQSQPGTMQNVARDRELRERVPDFEAAAAAMYISAGALLVTGVMLVLLSGDDADVAWTQPTLIRF